MDVWILTVLCRDRRVCECANFKDNNRSQGASTGYWRFLEGGECGLKKDREFVAGTVCVSLTCRLEKTTWAR